MSESPADRLRTLKLQGGYFPVGPRARFSIGGSDAKRYLNGQLTIDIGKIPQSSARGACLLTAKGKLCAVVFVWSNETGFLVDAPLPLRDELGARLERYIIADDVSVTDESTPEAGYHVFGSLPSPAGRAIRRLGVPGFDVLQPPPDALEATGDEVEILRIVNGSPQWGSELDADTLVQEARLEKTAVDFDKGCYVGQEVVSRLKSVGRVNRRLHGFIGDLNDPGNLPIRLAPVGRPDDSSGTLTSIRYDFELARTVALGYLHRNFESVDRFVATDSSGRTLGEVEKREFPIS